MVLRLQFQFIQGQLSGSCSFGQRKEGDSIRSLLMRKDEIMLEVQLEILHLEWKEVLLGVLDIDFWER